MSVDTNRHFGETDNAYANRIIKETTQEIHETEKWIEHNEKYPTSDYSDYLKNDFPITSYGKFLIVLRGIFCLIGVTLFLYAFTMGDLFTDFSIHGKWWFIISVIVIIIGCVDKYNYLRHRGDSTNNYGKGE